MSKGGDPPLREGSKAAAMFGAAPNREAGSRAPRVTALARRREGTGDRINSLVTHDRALRFASSVTWIYNEATKMNTSPSEEFPTDPVEPASSVEEHGATLDVDESMGFEAVAALVEEHGFALRHKPRNPEIHRTRHVAAHEIWINEVDTNNDQKIGLGDSLEEAFAEAVEHLKKMRFPAAKI